MFTELAVGVSAQFFKTESCVISANDEGGANGIVAVVGQDDDGCIAKVIALKLD